MESNFEKKELAIELQFDIKTVRKCVAILSGDVLTDEERLKDLRDEESKIDAEISRLKQRKIAIGIQVQEIENTLVNQIKMEL